MSSVHTNEKYKQHQHNITGNNELSYFQMEMTYGHTLNHLHFKIAVQLSYNMTIISILLTSVCYFQRFEAVCCLLHPYIVRRRSSLSGHVARLPEDTPAHQALRCHIDLSLGRLLALSWRRCPGRPRNRWLD